MIFVNPTMYPSLLIPTALDDDRILASVVLRVTYILMDGQLTPAEDQVWKVSPEPWDSPAGKMEGDEPFMRGGVDLFVFGRAWAPNMFTRTMTVCLKAGNFVREAVVTGRRTWVRDLGRKLVPSEPEVFASMPLTSSEAFGGTSEFDGLDVPFADNPTGKGYYITEEQALGQELPNLEETDHRMESWNDMPPVCGFGFCPQGNGARLQNGTILDDEHNIADFRPQLFNQAFVPMIAPSLVPGDPIELLGCSPDGPIRFVVPQPPVGVRLQFGERVVERMPFVDQIGIEAEAARVFVTWRFPFRFVVREREARMCQLFEGVSL